MPASPDPGTMSLTIFVPAGVPVVTHNSTPCEPVSNVFAVKKSFDPTATRLDGFEDDGPLKMLASICVVAPSETQISRPFTPSSAVKKTLLPIATSCCGLESPLGAMSAASLVPASVPSDTQSSRPWPPSLLTQKTWLPATTAPVNSLMVLRKTGALLPSNL